MLRVRTKLEGWAGGPGLSTFYFTAAAETDSEAEDCVTRVRAFFAGINGAFHTSVVITVDPAVSQIASATGNLYGILDGGLTSAVGGGSSADLAPPVDAALLKHVTADFSRGRRVVGRTFLSPLTEAKFTGGQVDPAVSAAIVAAAEAELLTGGTDALPIVWQRPVKEPVHIDGDQFAVISYQCPASVAILRSRRS